MKKILSSLIIIFILSAIFSYALSLGELNYSYSLDPEAKEVSLNDYLLSCENTDYNLDTGLYKPSNDDPWILYSQINNQYNGILIKLNKKASKDIPIKLYWTIKGSEALSERNTIEAVINKDFDAAYLSLPKFEINMIRLDIDEECTIESISLSDINIVKKPLYNYGFMKAMLIRFFIVFLILFGAYKYHLLRVQNGQKLISGFFINPLKEGVVHHYELDFIRALAALLVIMMHSVIETYAPSVSIGDPGYFTLKMVLAISLVCNALYIMLSGALLLQPKEESIKDFYKKRLTKVLIPTISYYLLYMFQGYPKEVFKDGIWSGLKEIGLGLLTSRPQYMLHMWFIYAILGLYILAPFLRIMISHITQGQLLGLIIAGFVCDILASTLPYFSLSFGIETPLASWMGVFLLGYYMTTEHAKRYYKLFMGLGVLGLIITCFSVYYHPEYLYYESNWAPMMWLEGAGIFAFFIYFKKLFGKKNIIVQTISKYNFSIMLIHVLLLMKFILPTGWRMQASYGHLSLFIIGMIIVCFLMSYVVSLIYDNTVISAVDYYLYKAIHKKEIHE